MKKLISLVLALALVLGVMSFASADDKVVINLTRDCFNLGGGTDADQLKKVENAINAYIADKINVEVHITEYSSATAIRNSITKDTDGRLTRSAKPSTVNA